jgi:hypothetical protein
MSRRRGPQVVSRRPPLATARKGGFTPILSGIGPSITATETLFSSKSLTITITLGGILGVALFTATDGANIYAGLGALGSVTLPGALGAVTLQFSAATYVVGQVYTGVV